MKRPRYEWHFKHGFKPDVIRLAAVVLLVQPKSMVHPPNLL